MKRTFRALGIEVSRAASPAMRLRGLTWLREFGIGTVLDVGANTGQFAVLVREALPDALIYSFEPIADCRARLVARMQHDAKFAAMPYALGAADVEADIHRNTFTPSSSLLPMAQLHKDLFPMASGGQPERIRVRPLDDVRPSLEVRPSLLIKVDVQGYEGEVIAGGPRTFNEATVAIIETAVETLYEGQPSFEDIFRRMDDLGFRFGGVSDQLLSPAGRPLQADVVFVRRGVLGASA